MTQYQIQHQVFKKSLLKDDQIHGKSSANIILVNF